MAVTNHERVGKALVLLSQGLAPFVERECKAQYGDGWVQALAKLDTKAVQQGKKASPTDAQFLLKVVWDEWQQVFRKVLGITDRTYVSELRDVRNRWAHQETFSTDDAERALDTMRRLLLAVSAPEQAIEVDGMRQDLRRAQFAEQARQSQRKAAVAAVEGQPKRGLKPWRELVTPHKDVASGRYQQAEFAADLFQVWRDEAADEYGQPVEFFRRTFLTEGLRKLLLNAVRRFNRDGGDPVVELQTNFGGGKTHSMIALYHLAAGYPPHELPGVEAMLADAGLNASPAANTAVLVGQWIEPAVVHDKGDDVQIHTLWGELAWQLGGADGYALVAGADRAKTNPGAALIELLRRYSPCLILIDEWVAYARLLYGVDNLPAGTFDTQFTFAQALAEAARAVEGALLVVSIPASDIEVGGEGGQLALDRLKNVIGRVESSWRPASAEEGFEIVRRRLFDELPAASAPDRDAVVRAFGDLYRSQKAEFPSGCSEGDYERRLAAAYPIHPEVFDRLYGEWSTLDKFQRTRGVLRLMAAVVHELWERNDSGLLIMPATIPIDAPQVSTELTRYLEEGWTPVIESDIDGPNALPLQLDRDNPNFGRYSATRRVARTIYLGSAPTQQAANRGIDDRSLKLGCVQPGEAPAIFGDALRRLTDRATYLYVDKQRYWYSLQPSVTRLARDRAAHFSDDDVDEEIRRRLVAVTRPAQRGDFATVHPAPRSPGDVPDEPEARLVVLGPAYEHSPKTADSPARTAAGQFLAKRAAGDRLHRNMLVFLAPDKSRLGELRQAVRDYLAWRSIEADKETLNLDTFQASQAERKRSDFDEAVAQRVGETFVWLLVPSQDPDDPMVRWDEARVNGSGPLAVRVSRRLDTDEELITGYSATRLRMDLDRQPPLWPGDHVGLKQLWSYYSQYPYLPRLRDSGVLLDAIRQGVSSATWNPDTFAYAGSFDETTGRYSELVAGEIPAVHLDASSVLVKPDVAARQIAADAPTPSGPGTEPTDVTGSGAGADDQTSDGQPTTSAAVPSKPTRFYGRVEVEPVRMLRDLGEIADAIVNQLGRSDAEVTMTVEIEARASGGFDDDVRRTVDENARTLHFEAHGFEDE